MMVIHSISILVLCSVDRYLVQGKRKVILDAQRKDILRGKGAD